MVAGVVRPRRHLVDEQAPVGTEEKFHPEYADVIECDGDVLGRLACLFEQCLWQSRGDDRHVEDVVAVLVFGRVVGLELAIAPAHDDDRELGGEVDLFFEHGAR